MASLEATVVLWPAGDGTREIRIEMPDQVAASSSGRCLTADEQNRPLLVVTWSTFQLCFYISQVISRLIKAQGRVTSPLPLSC
jgi:hypothetical protein